MLEVIPVPSGGSFAFIGLENYLDEISKEKIQFNPNVCDTLLTAVQVEIDTLQTKADEYESWGDQMYQQLIDLDQTPPEKPTVE